MFEIHYSNELYHHGVKGMKWGVRNKKELKVANKFSKAARYKGAADFYKQEGNKASAQYDHDAKVLDKQAKAWDRKGYALAAEMARRKSQRLKEQGQEARREYDEKAAECIRLAEKSTEKAKKYASKKKVNLGKQTINAIMKDSRTKELDRQNRSKESSERLDEMMRETEA